MEALYRLAWMTDKAGMVPVNWRAMETEELGSVYESLLELQPQLGDDGVTLVFASEAAEQKGNQRKTTGSYYTPDSLVQALLDTALDPVLDRTEAEADDPAKALLKLSVIDPACGSGHFLLAAARRIATRLARIRAEEAPSLADFRHALRDVARCCIHGVDRNPMAVELTKVALWIETVDPGLPLGFFDAQIRCGDALLGVFDLKVLQDGIPDAAYKPLTGDDKDTAKYYLKANRDATAGQGGFDFGAGKGAMPAIKPMAVDFSGFRDLPEDTVEQIGAKAKRFKELRKGQTFVRAKAAADLYVAAFLMPKVGGAPSGASARTVPTTEELWMALNQGQMRQSMADVPKAARRARAFHWPLEFPDVMQRGGFDVVLGNPPWEVMQLSEKEYFAAKHPEIASLAGAARKRAIDQLKNDNLVVYADFENALRMSEAGNEFARASGRFDLTARGKVNTYALFAEHFANLARMRAGVIVPTGIATDATTAPFFAALVKNKRLAKLVDFENRAGLFPAVHSAMKFSLLTLGREEHLAAFSFFLTDPGQLMEPERNFTMSADEIALINPNSGTAPIFRARYDAALTAKIYSSSPVLIREEKDKQDNPWGLEFRQGLFNMTSDSELFRTAVQLQADGFVRDGMDWVLPEIRPAQSAMAADGPGVRLLAQSEDGLKTIRYVPLCEAKMISFFDHRFAGYAARGNDRGYRVLPETTPDKHANPGFEIEPFYWVRKCDLDERLSERTKSHWLLGWKDVTAATNERTAIFSIIPRVAVGHTLPLMFSTESVERLMGLYANLNSLVADYTARNSVAGLHLTYGYLKQFPIFSPAFYSKSRLTFIVPRVLELTYTSHSLASFARDLGHDGQPFAWNEDRRALLRADLDAFYARAYGLTRDELRYILDPADVKGAEYPSETFRVLKDNEIRQHGEYRTRRLVLKAWDRMEAQGEFQALGL
ncbi:N-6 DNA methylase [Nitrobacter sp.]|uniref:Eco57I restriction-modification methylase domain-containing protein n=1 Tax=Nitrobacter sp. TaxID=29420 RepID=UPI00321FB404